MAGVLTIKFSVMKEGIKALDMKSPIYIPGPVETQFGPGRHIYFEGFSVDEHGKQYYLDATVAYRQSCLRVIEYLRRYGYDDYQIYLLMSCAPIQGHIAGIVDVWLMRHFCCSMADLDRFQMHAQRLDCRWISSTLTSRLMYLLRRRIWANVHLLASYSNLSHVIDYIALLFYYTNGESQR